MRPCSNGASRAPLPPWLLVTRHYNTAQVYPSPPPPLLVAPDSRAKLLSEGEGCMALPRPVLADGEKASQRVSVEWAWTVVWVEGAPLCSVCVSQERVRLSTFSCDRSLSS
jgi:hypothetical protein